MSSVQKKSSIQGLLKLAKELVADAGFRITVDQAQKILKANGKSLRDLDSTEGGQQGPVKLVYTVEFNDGGRIDKEVVGKGPSQYFLRIKNVAGIDYNKTLEQYMRDAGGMGGGCYHVKMRGLL